MAVDELWGKVPISVGDCLEWKLQNLGFCIAAEEDEWHVLIDRERVSRKPVLGRRRASMPEGEIKRFVTVLEDELTLLPALPEKPVVIRPDGPIVLLPERTGTFSFAVPLWISFCGGEKTGDVVFWEEPSTLLSNTWFGEIGAGELCYSVDTHLRRELPQIIAPLEAVCAVQVTNGSTDKLNFERLCVHVENLNLYRADGILRTNDLKVLYKGVDQSSQIDISNTPPVSEAVLLRGPRVSVNRNIIHKTFDVLRVVTGI